LICDLGKTKGKLEDKLVKVSTFGSPTILHNYHPYHQRLSSSDIL